MKLSQKILPFQTDFHVTTNFRLPIDGLLGITTMKIHGMIIKKIAKHSVIRSNNDIWYGRASSMDAATRLIFLEFLF